MWLSEKHIKNKKVIILRWQRLKNSYKFTEPSKFTLISGFNYSFIKLKNFVSETIGLICECMIESPFYICDINIFLSALFTGFYAF